MKQRLNGLQILRFIAATLVVFNHSLYSATESWVHRVGGEVVPAGISISTGAIGVQIFFGISGFIMVRTQFDQFGSAGSALDFALRRIKRIVPIYLIATTIDFAIHLRSDRPEMSVINYLKSILFIPYREPNGLFQPILGQGWTLNYEMFFYAVFAVGLLAPRRIGLTATLGGLTALAVTDMIFGNFDNFYISHKLIYFVLGGCLAIAEPHIWPGKRVSFLQCAGVMALHGFLILLPDRIGVTPGDYHYGWEVFHMISAVLVPLTVFAFVRCEPLRHPRLAGLFERLGDASFSTYLFHGFGISLLKPVGGFLVGESYAIAVALAAVGMVAGNLVGLLCYRWIERPLMRINWRQDLGRLVKAKPVAQLAVKSSGTDGPLA